MDVLYIRQVLNTEVSINQVTFPLSLAYTLALFLIFFCHFRVHLILVDERDID